MCVRKKYKLILQTKGISDRDFFFFTSPQEQTQVYTLTAAKSQYAFIKSEGLLFT